MIDNDNPVDLVSPPTIRTLNNTEYDFTLQLGACIDAMSQSDAMGETLLFYRKGACLCTQYIHSLDLGALDIDRYEMILFDGGNTHGDRWKHVFFPQQKSHFFNYKE
ncbi:uridylate kinase [Pseudomonas fluorescens HK44]|uniref:Uridylate kinase n=1 Tax=Pseudomonas fluorescens HK44 TaxID=1042209 RepID=A0A010S5V0_PSEFL|nr:hypothetical protein [Pseudomonas fluorescens]EXF95919.1 uridylate kinase [Pseudomonas fluorescens HK44]